MTDDEQKAIFARNLKKQISISGKLQKDIAKDLNIPIQTFNGWCNGVSIPTMGKVQKIADYFKIGKSDLLDDQKVNIIPAVTAYEFDYVQKIRMLDKYGHKAVMETIDREFNRCAEQNLSGKNSTA